MAEIIKFPGAEERDWRVWEEAIRDANKTGLFSGDVLEESIPRIKEHWKCIFESVAITPRTVQIPGPLTAEQLEAIQEVTDATAEAMVARIKKERSNSLALLMQLELRYAYLQRYGSPT